MILNKIQLEVDDYSEYNTLKKVILCSPQYMRIQKVINRVQRKFVKENINAQLAVKQHNELISTLEENNIEVILLDTQEKYPEQVFTRDIGFIIGNNFFISSMKNDIRRGEINILEQWLENNNLQFVELGQGCVEGGDIIIDRSIVWVGIGNRTSNLVVKELADKCKGYTIHPVFFDKRYLHLDCIFNIISEQDALIYPDAFTEEDYLELDSRYNLIEVTKKEQFTLGTNVLSIGDRIIISSPQNMDINEKLYKNGYSVIEVDISEILKSGGAFRCVTLPLLRVIE